MNLSAAVTLWLMMVSTGPAKATSAMGSAGAEGLQTSAAQAPATSTAQSPEPAVDAAKEASIRKLLDLTGASKLMLQTIANMKDTIRPLILSSLPVGEYRERLVDLFFERFQTKLDPASLINLIVPIYAKYLSQDELDGLIKFYQTPLGQKALSVVPQILSESQLAGKQFGEKAGRESMIEVLQEHPDLRQAIQEAAAKKQ